MTITPEQRQRLQLEKDALLQEAASIRSQAQELKSQGSSATTAEQMEDINSRQESLVARVKQISSRLNEINQQLAQETFPPAQGAQFTVTNYVTLQVLETNNSPNYGDPNKALQSQVNAAYNTPSVQASGITTPTVSTIANPAADLMAAARSSSQISAEQLLQLNASLGSLSQVGQVPTLLTNMSSHAQNVLDQPTRVFDAINLTFQPDQAGTVGRCQTLGGFIGSIQGAFNGTLGAITAGLNNITSALVAVPQAILAGFTTATSAAIAAITSGVQQVINTTIQAVTQVTSGLFNALGSAVTSLVDTVGQAVGTVAQAINLEIKNVSDALNSMLQNAFRLVVPNTTPCVGNIFAASNPASSNWTFLTPSGQGMSMSNTVNYDNLTDLQKQLRADTAKASASIQQFNSLF
jgi:hypothetical protein